MFSPAKLIRAAAGDRAQWLKKPAEPAALSWPMESAPDMPRSFDFCFIHLDYTLVRVEEVEGRVTIRATADTFSKRRKMCFIRELVAEGFISDDRCHCLFEGDPESYGLRWLVDPSWVKPDKALLERNHRLVKRYLLPLTFLWLALTYLAVSGHGGIRAWNAASGAPRTGAYGSR
jgi:hypothetical protein